MFAFPQVLLNSWSVYMILISLKLQVSWISSVYQKGCWNFNGLIWQFLYASILSTDDPSSGSLSYIITPEGYY